MDSILNILLRGCIVVGCVSCAEKEHPVPPYSVPNAPEVLTTEPYDWEKTRNDIPSSTDMVLIYGGGHHRSPYTWGSERLADYVTYTDTDQKEYWLFDNFLFLEILDAGAGGANKKFASGYTYNNNPLESANKEDWKKLIDYYFQPGSGIAALETCIGEAVTSLGEPSYKRQVIISIPEPIVYQTTDKQSTIYWGEIGGEKMNFAKSNDRVLACQWFIDQVRAEFNKKNYLYVELAGFYWLAENSTDTYAILNTVAHYLNELKYSFNWIPYFNANGYDKWESYGFHYAYLQPNYFFNESVSESRLDEACVKARESGMHMELEFDDNALNSKGKAYRLRDYMNAFRRHGIWSEKRLAYYQGGSSLRSLKYSSDDADQKLYHDFCRFVVTRPIRKSD